jgi:hypothetical protein
MQMIDRVNDSFHNMSAILTANLDRAQAGKFDHRELPDIDDDINKRTRLQ